MKQMIISIDEGTDFDALPEDQQADVNLAKIQWPEAVMIGTETVDGKSLILIATTASVSVIESMISNHSLDWAVLAIENIIVDQSVLLPFYSDVPVFDEDGEQTGTEAVTDLTGKIQTFSGHSWSY